MWIGLGIAAIVVVGLVLLFRSDFGKDLRTLTDAQLYRRHNAYLKHSKIGLASDINAWVKAQEELGRMGDEFKRRGLDLNKLFAEELNATFEERPMDFSKGRIGAQASVMERADALVTACAKAKSFIDMLKSGIAAEKLQRGANESDLRYYVGYITAVSRSIAGRDGVEPNGVILAAAQIEVSRVLGKSQNLESDYAEGIELLPTILVTADAAEGLRDGELDGAYAVEPSNPGPYFGKLRERFGVLLPAQRIQRIR